MDVIEKVLTLRPTNAVLRLGATSRLPLLNPRDLVRALSDGASALLCVPVPELCILPGVLRAAREVDAILGLAAPYAPVDRDSPYRFVEALRRATEDVRHERPIFLQAGPVRLLSAEDAALEQTADLVFRYLDAGFSLLSLDGSRLPPEDSQKACIALSQMAVERELSVEVTAPRSAVGRTSPEVLADFLRVLAQGQAKPRFVRVCASRQGLDAAPLDGRDLDLELLGELRAVAGDFDVALTVEDAGTGPQGALTTWVDAGVRKVDAVESFGRLAARALKPALRATLEQKAKLAQLPLGEVLAQSDQWLQDAEGQVRDRLEALAYAEVSDLLALVRSQGSASSAISFLAERAGY